MYRCHDHPVSKPARTIAEQIDLLESRGLRLGAGERNRLPRLLMSHGYYRLSGYWRYFQVAPHLGDDRFRPDATLDDIESPTSYLRRDAYCAQVVARDGQIVELRDELLLDIRRELRRSKEDFIAHHRRRGVPVPVWAAVEALTFGAVSKIYRLIDDGDVRYSVAKSFGLDPKRTESTVRALAVLRNVCAHHGRLSNRVRRFPSRSRDPCSVTRTGRSTDRRCGGSSSRLPPWSTASGATLATPSLCSTSWTGIPSGKTA